MRIKVTAYLKVSSNIESNSSGGVNDIKYREIETESQYARAKNYNKC